MGSARQIAPGLRRWTARHDEWNESVASLALDTGDGLVLIDPIDPPPSIGAPAHVLLTVYWHARAAATLGAPRIWAPKRSGQALHAREIVVTDAFRAGDALPGGVLALQTPRAAEVAYWLPDQRALVVGDVLLGAGAKPHATSAALRLCPERWLGKGTHEDLRRMLRPLLDLPLEHVLVSHGEPIIGDGREALAAVLA
jgi:glyoxylase-like metal-dependent hydrolase (beta-lactamase superfamily II)